MAVPCLTKLSMLGSNYKGNEGVRDDCETDYKTTIDYMEGPVEIVTYRNHVKFETSTYGEGRLKQSSRLIVNQISIEDPHWIETTIDTFELIDEVSVL